jgi:hypothetical protein
MPMPSCGRATLSSGYAFTLRVNRILVRLSARPPTWTMGATMELNDVTIAASGVHVVDNWDIAAHGDRLAVTILTADSGYLNVRRATAAPWSITQTSGGPSHTWSGSGRGSTR